MEGKTVKTDAWEDLVKRQLKTDDIYTVLAKENLEGIIVKPYYSHTASSFSSLPKTEESTQLVARYAQGLEDDVYAFLLKEGGAQPAGKTIFVSQEFIEDNFEFRQDNRYISLADIFNDLGGRNDNYLYQIDKNFGERLLKMPYERAICVDISAHQNAGASVKWQLAVALAKVKELVEVFGPEIFKKITLKIAIGGNYFFEIAKIRALKLLYNQLSKEFGLNEIPYIFAETSLRNKAANDEENNLIRSTIELSAAMIGGADAVFSRNYKMRSQTALSEEISFKQQIVLAYESIVNVFDDAASGSFYVDDVTRQFAENSWKLFLEIEEKGGYLECLKSGYVQQEIREHALLEQKWVEEGKTTIIGVNLYPRLEKKKSAEELYPVDRIALVRLAEMFE